MSDILFHEAAQTTRDLNSRLTQIVQSLPTEDARRIQSSLSATTHERPQLVFTGQYSSGKSTLIKALTDETAQVVIDSAVATDKVEVFDWDGLVDLVDTPGVQAGVVEHDEMSEDALRAADLILFTVSVDLFDDGAVQHLRHITDDLGKAGQLLIVITKSRTLDQSDEIRDAAVRAALGEYAGAVPWVACDAQTYLTGLHEPTPARRDRRMRASNMGAVRAAIDRLSRERGNTARMAAPLQQLRSLADDTLALLTEDPQEQVVRTVLNRRRTLAVTTIERLEVALRLQGGPFKAEALTAAQRRVDELERDEVELGRQEAQARARDALNADLEAAEAAFLTACDEQVERAHSAFLAESDEISGGPAGRYVTRLAAGAGTAPAAARMPVSFLSRPDRTRVTQKILARFDPTATARRLQQVADTVGQFSDLWRAGGNLHDAQASMGGEPSDARGGVDTRSGPRGRDGKYTQTAAKAARRVEIGAQFASNHIGTVHAALVALDDHQRLTAEAQRKQERRRTTLAQVSRGCEEFVEACVAERPAELRAFTAWLIATLDEELANLDNSDAARSETGRALREIQAAAEAMLDRLAAAPVTPAGA